MTSEKNRDLLLKVLTCVLIVAVAALAYVVFQTNSRLETLVTTGKMAATTPTDEEGDNALAAPGGDATDTPRIWDPFRTPFDPNHWDPFNEMDEMHRRIDAMFNDAFGRFGRSPRIDDLLQEPGFTPRMDLVEEGDHYVVRLDVPGAEESEIKVSLEDQTLTIEAASKLAKEEKQVGQIIRRERRIGRFRRQITLPEPVDADTMKTEYEDGVLTVTIEKGS